MLHILCYFAAGLVNLVWLLLGDHLDLFLQTAAPAVTVLLAGTGVALRLRSLPREAGARYLRGALWALFLYYLAILSVLLFFGGLFQLDRVWGGSVNLEPFHTIRNYVRFYRNTGSPVSIMNLLGNAVIMVPPGGAAAPAVPVHVPFLDLPAPVCPDRGGGGVAPVGHSHRGRRRGRLHFEFSGGRPGVFSGAAVPAGGRMAAKQLNLKE